MNCSFCATAIPALRPNAATATAVAAITVLNSLIFSSLVARISGLLGPCRYSRQRGNGQSRSFSLPRPQPRQTFGLDNQEEDNQRAEDHRLQIGHEIDRNLDPAGRGALSTKDRGQHDEGGTEQRAQNAAE